MDSSWRAALRFYRGNFQGGRRSTLATRHCRWGDVRLSGWYKRCHLDATIQDLVDLDEISQVSMGPCADTIRMECKISCRAHVRHIAGYLDCCHYRGGDRNVPAFSKIESLTTSLQKLTRRARRFLRNNQVSISPSWFVVLLSLGNILIYNYSVFSYSFANIDYFSLHGALTLLTIFVVQFVFAALIFFVLTLISPYVLKVFCVAAAIGNSVAIYFIATYHVALDRSMMSNVFNTRVVESVEFLHPKLIAYVVVLGLIPAWLIVRTNVERVKRARILVHLLVTLVAGLSFIYVNASTSLWIDKHASRLGGVLLPWSYAINSVRLKVEESRANRAVELLPAIHSNNDDPTVVVLVIGETARADNLSLYGYERLTNPLLAERAVVSLQNATSCSTYTTASIHCMLSHDGSRSGNDEPLPSYLQRNGIDVVWRSNNWGEPRVEVQSYEESTELVEACSTDNCDFDEVLLSGLADRIQSSLKKKVFVVLHTKGSHGPSYFTKYPETFQRFSPVCETVELDKCTEEELINAYDNSILYTDYFLDQAISVLESLNGTPALLLYVSDHGESLGEYGLYLHGTPYSIAPDVQKKIPFILWMSDSFLKQRGIRKSDFLQDEYSHSNVFHSILGAFGLKSEIYAEELDIFSNENE